MKNLYLFHYWAGTCGDFVCLEVSKDKNFYPNALIHHSETNRWLGSNPLTEFNLDYKEGMMTVTPETYKLIDEKFQERNLIIPAHRVKRNLPRLKVVRSYVKDQTYIPMFFIMLYVKALMQKKYLEDPYESLIFLGPLHYSHGLFKSLKLSYQNLKNVAANSLIDNIEQKGFYYNFELRALEFNFVHMKNIIPEQFFVYKHRLMSKFPADIHLAVDQLLIDPSNNVQEFSRSVNMSEPLKVEQFEMYNQANFDLIEKIFNKPYHSLIQGNWQDEFQEYVNQECPDNWFNRS
jgi:hypothetical protein